MEDKEEKGREVGGLDGERRGGRQKGRSRSDVTFFPEPSTPNQKKKIGRQLIIN